MFFRTIFFACMLIATLAASLHADDFWYGVEGPVQLSVDSNKVMVKISLGTSPDEALGSIERFVALVPEKHSLDGFIACSLSTGSGYAAFLDSLRSLPGVIFAEPYCLSPGGFPMLVGQDFIAAFLPGPTASSPIYPDEPQKAVASSTVFVFLFDRIRAIGCTDLPDTKPLPPD